MRRHVFPSPLLVLAALLGTLVAGVRAQDGDEPVSDPPATEETGAKGAAEDGAAAAEPEAAAEDAPPAVGAAFPATLAVRPLPREGAAADEEPEKEPSVTLATLRGEKKRPLVVVFWSARCPVCKRYTDVLQKLSSALGDKAALVLVASGAEETAETVRATLRTAELTVPAYLDTDRSAADALGVRVTPTAFLVDAEGVLRYRGPIDDDRRARSRDARELLKPAVEAVLAGKEVENGDVRPFGSALR